MNHEATPTEPVTIDRQAPLPPAQDFDALKAQALAWLPEWCAGNWTDFNDHDPGIMILEQVTYAGTELAYRAGLPMERLLSDATGKVPWAENSLYPPTEILPIDPLTANDYARLLYDRIPELVYAAVAPIPLAAQALAPGVPGLLQARISVGPDADAATRQSALAEAGLVLARQANLGERFESIAEQPLVFFGLSLGVQLAPGSSAELVRDNLYLAVRQALLPGPRFQTLAEALKQQTLDETLAGPLLQRGVLPDAELPDLLSWTEVKERTAQAVMKTPGVQAVTSIVFTAPADTTAPQLYTPGPVATITAQVRTTAAAGSRADYQVVFQATGSDVGPPVPSVNVGANFFIQSGGQNPVVQFRRLLPTPTWTMPAVPDAPTTSVGEYYSIQNTFPTCFALQADNLPPPTPALRRAQAWQLKGYLLLFEQLMANYFAQLSNLSRFFSNRTQDRTVFTQPLASVPGVMPLLAGSIADELPADPATQAAYATSYWEQNPANPYLTGLRAVAESVDEQLARRSAVLDQLLARFNESFPNGDQTTYETIVNQQDLLQAYPVLGRRRAQAADMADGMIAGQPRPRSGLEEKMQVLLRRDTQPGPAQVSETTGAMRVVDPADFYHVLEPIRFLPRADSASAGERWNLPLSAFAPGLYHVYVNWTLAPLTAAFTGYVEALVEDNAPAHLNPTHVWLETQPVAVANVARFRALYRAWAVAGYPPLVLAPPRLAGDPALPTGTIDVCRGTAAADLFAWLLDPTADPTGPAGHYFEFAAGRFEPRPDSASAGERWNLAAASLTACQYHVSINWTSTPLTAAAQNEIAAYIRGRAPAGIDCRFVWLETVPRPVAAVAEFRRLVHAWELAGRPPLVLAPPRLASDEPLPAGTMDVCRGTAAADLLAWLLATSTPSAPGEPALA